MILTGQNDSTRKTWPSAVLYTNPTGLGSSLGLSG